MMEKWFKMKKPQVKSWKHEEIDRKEEQRSVTAVTSEKWRKSDIGKYHGRDNHNKIAF